MHREPWMQELAQRIPAWVQRAQRESGTTANRLGAVKRKRLRLDSRMCRADQGRCGMVEGRGVEPPTPTLRT